jgi:hypothetical protein
VEYLQYPAGAVGASGVSIKLHPMEAYYLRVATKVLIFACRLDVLSDYINLCGQVEAADFLHELTIITKRDKR